MLQVNLIFIDYILYNVNAEQYLYNTPHNNPDLDITWS